MISMLPSTARPSNVKRNISNEQENISWRDLNEDFGGKAF